MCLLNFLLVHLAVELPVSCVPTCSDDGKRRETQSAQLHVEVTGPSLQFSKFFQASNPSVFFCFFFEMVARLAVFRGILSANEFSVLSALDRSSEMCVYERMVLKC